MADVYRSYVFEIAINCCRSCPEKLKTGLLRIEGIESVDIDLKNNLVTVKTYIDSSIIIKKIGEWGKTAKLLHEITEENIPHGYKVEIHDEEEEDEEKVGEGSFFRCLRRGSSKDSSSRRRGETKATHAPEKYDAQSNLSSPKEFPEHICRDKYCTFHKRDATLSDRVPNMDYQPMFHGGGGNNSFPIRNSYVPPPPPQYRQYGYHPLPPQYRQYGSRMVPQVVGYGGGYATQRQMPRPDASAYYDEYSNGCRTM